MFASNVYRLVDDLTELFDTPSKRTLWHHVIPLLTIPHQEFCQQVVGFSTQHPNDELSSKYIIISASIFYLLYLSPMSDVDIVIQESDQIS
jgi:hypothetical protein